jgi:hypothetical protein
MQPARLCRAIAAPTLRTSILAAFVRSSSDLRIINRGRVIEACEKAGIDPYVPRPQRGPAVRAGLFRKDEFG